MKTVYFTMAWCFWINDGTAVRKQEALRLLGESMPSLAGVTVVLAVKLWLPSARERGPVIFYGK